MFWKTRPIPTKKTNPLYIYKVSLLENKRYLKIERYLEQTLHGVQYIEQTLHGVQYILITTLFSDLIAYDASDYGYYSYISLTEKTDLFFSSSKDDLQFMKDLGEILSELSI